MGYVGFKGPSNDTPISLVARSHRVLQEDARWKLNAVLQEKSPRYYTVIPLIWLPPSNGDHQNYYIF